MPVSAPRPCRHCKCRTPNTNGYCDDHQDKLKQSKGWNKTNKGKSTTERGYGWQWQKTRKRVLQRDNYSCVPCMKQGFLKPADDVDHIINKKAGGTDDEDNLQSICTSCHKDKTKQESLVGRGVKSLPTLAT